MASRLGRFGVWSGIAIVSALVATADAAAEGMIGGLRVGGGAGYDRLVFDLGSLPVAVTQMEAGDLLQVDFEASAPLLDSRTLRKLSVLGVRLEPTERGTRVAVDRRGRSSVAFRLRSQSGGRVVVDLGKGSTPLSVPPDAELLPIGAAAPARPVEPAIQPAPALPAQNLAPAPAPAPAPGPVGTAPSNAADGLWVRVRGIDFPDMPAGSPTRDELLELELSLAVESNGDVRAAPTGAAGQRFTLRQLTSTDRGASRLNGSVLQQIVEKIADAYAEQGKYGTRVDIEKRDLDRLVSDPNASLVIRIREGAPATN
jgi:hypothetical protein